MAACWCYAVRGFLVHRVEDDCDVLLVDHGVEVEFAAAGGVEVGGVEFDADHVPQLRAVRVPFPHLSLTVALTQTKS